MPKKSLSTLTGWGAAGIGVLTLYAFILRPWYLRWGTTAEEVRRPLPGDELVPQPKQMSTRSITLQASVAEIWPWLVQLGQGRGGLYSYDWLENLIGCDIHNAERIMPEFQDLKVGDKVRLGPEGYPFYTVAAFEPGRALILRAGDPHAGEPPVDETWTFFLDPIDAGTTRLIVRNRRDYPPSLANFVIWRVMTEPAHFIMERKMLLGIKQRAEQAAYRQRR